MILGVNRLSKEDMMDDIFFDDQQTINRIIERIDSLRTERGSSVSGLALEANLSENTLKHLYKRKTYPTLQTLYRISAALGYPLWQLLAFDNKAYTLSAQERELLNAYNRLSPRHRELLLHIANKI